MVFYYWQRDYSVMVTGIKWLQYVFVVATAINDELSNPSNLSLVLW